MTYKTYMHANQVTQEQIYVAIQTGGYSAYTLQLIDNYTQDILYGRTNFSRFNLQEHAGLCSADSVLIGAYTVASYARASLESSGDASASQASPTNWDIDELQEHHVQQWAESKMFLLIKNPINLFV